MTESLTEHITVIDPRDSAGHYAWHCTTCRKPDADGSGYETGREVVEAATAHGPLAADSLKPVDPSDDDDGEPEPPELLPPLLVLRDFAHQLRLPADDIPNIGANPERRRAVFAASLAAGFIGRARDYVAAVDPEVTPEQMAALFTMSTLQAAGGDVDAAMALSMVMFRWGTDTVRGLTQEDAIDHLVEALALLIDTYRDEGSDTTDDPKWIEEQTPDPRVIQALSHMRKAVDELMGNLALMTDQHGRENA